MPQCACVKYGFTRTTFLSFASRQHSITWTAELELVQTAVTNQNTVTTIDQALVYPRIAQNVYKRTKSGERTHRFNYKNCCDDKRLSISSTNQASLMPLVRCRSIREHVQLIVNGSPIRKIPEQESAVPLHPRRQHLLEFSPCEPRTSCP